MARRRRVLEVTAPLPDGTTQQQTHETTDDIPALARIIAGVADEAPGVPVSFTVTTTEVD